MVTKTVRLKLTPWDLKPLTGDPRSTYSHVNFLFPTAIQLSEA